MLLPTMLGGTPDIDDEVYETVAKKWIENQNKDDGYRHMALHQSSAEDK